METDGVESIKDARERLNVSFKEVNRNLGLYSKAIINSGKCKLGEVNNKLKSKFLNFKSGVKQKATKAKTYIGNVPTKIKAGVHNVNVKLSNAFGITVGAVASFTTEQIDKYRTWKQKKRQEKNDREVEQQAALMAEKEKRAQEMAKRAAARQELLLAEQARRNQELANREEKKLENKLNREIAFLNFKSGVKQKVTKAKTYIGNVPTKIKAGVHNVNVKLSNAFGITVGAVASFTAEQIDK